MGRLERNSFCKLKWALLLTLPQISWTTLALQPRRSGSAFLSQNFAFLTTNSTRIQVSPSE